MKKVIYLSFLSVALVSGYLGYNHNRCTTEELSSVEMENLEALTDDEGGQIWIPCSTAGGSCTFSIITADGKPGTLTIKEIHKAPYTN